jgi:hypothetical protein
MPNVAVGMSNKLSCYPFRRACERRIGEGWTWNEIGDAYYGKTDCNHNSSAIRRLVGILPEGRSKGRSPKPRAYIKYDSAVKLVRALALDPIDFDI